MYHIILIHVVNDNVHDLKEKHDDPAALIMLQLVL